MYSYSKKRLLYILNNAYSMFHTEYILLSSKMCYTGNNKKKKQL